MLRLLETGGIEFKNLIEIGALLEGRKNVVRLVLAPSRVRATCRFFEHHYPDLTIRLSSFLLQEVFRMTSADRFQRRVPLRQGVKGERVAFIGKPSAVEEAWTVEAGECLDVMTARLYGYPACCCNTYQRIAGGENWLEVFFRAEPHFNFFDVLNNRLSSVASPCLAYHFDYFPCSVTCPETLQINRLNREMLVCSDLPEFAPLADAHLAAATILYQGNLWYVRLQEFEHGKCALQRPINPAIPGDSATLSRLEGLEINMGEARANIDGRWRSTDAGEVRVYVFGDGGGIKSG